MNTQEIFDKVTRHLLTQNAKAEIVRNGRQVCMYRAPDGKSCAVGCLIKDEFYAPEFENCIILNDARVQTAVSLSLGVALSPAAIQLLVELQGVHDDCAVVQWPANLRDLASCHGLSSAVVEELRPGSAAEGGV